MQRSPTIASVGDLVSDPWSSSAPKLLHEQKENPPWAEQGLATYSNCHLLKRLRSSHWLLVLPELPLETCKVLAQDLVQHHKVADVVIEIKSSET